VDDEQQASLRVVADQRITRLLVAIGLDDAQKRVEERLRGLFERDPVLVLVARGLGRVPDKGDAVKLDARVPATNSPSVYC
jgi:hypothetical protein